MSFRPKIELFILIVTIILFSSCDHGPVQRKYTEIIIESLQMSDRRPSNLPADHPDISMPRMNMDRQDPQTQQMLKESIADIDLKWTKPEGWREEKGSSLRIATFKTNEGDQSILCTIVSLSGNAGGMKSNVIRWLRQIQVTDVSDSDLIDYLQRLKPIRSKGGFKVILTDLTEFQKSFDSQTPSMIAAIVENKSNTIFIKMTGSIAGVQHNSKKFKELCQSLK